MAKPVPCYLLTGILGAGKTTVLNHILSQPGDRRLAVVVNDFGEVDVDGQLVETTAGPQVSLANGCICCTIREDLEVSLVELLRENPDLDGLILEASGVADPQPIANTLVLSEQLRPLTRMDSIVAVVDVEAFPLLRGQNAYLARRQVAAADLILFNKTDLVSSNQVHKVISSLETWVSQLRTIPCSHGRVPLEILFGESRFRAEQLPSGPSLEVHVHTPGEGCHHHSGDQWILQTWTFQGPGRFRPRALSNLLKTLPLGVYRAKGFARLQGEGETVFGVQLCGTRLDIRPAPGPADQDFQNQLVFLGEPDALDTAQLGEKLEEALREEDELSPSDKLLENVSRLLGPV